MDDESVFTPTDWERIRATYRELLRFYGATPLARIREAVDKAADRGHVEPSADGMQRPRLLRVPGMPIAPWYDPRAAPGTEALELHWKDMRAEILDAMSRRRGFQANVEDGSELERGNWNVLYLKNDPESFADNRALCPKTARVLDTLPRLALAMFSAMTPGSRLRPHCGPWNARLTLHLGLIVPPGCGIRVGHETRGWTEGQTLVFDDSFEHEAWNEGASVRTVLLCDVWHPALTDIEVEFFSRIRAVIRGDNEYFLKAEDHGRQARAQAPDWGGVHDA